MKPQGYCFDVESNGFYFEADKIWVVWLKDLNNPDKKLRLLPFQDPEAHIKFKEFHQQYDKPFVVGHFLLGFDIFMVMRHLNVDFYVSPDKMYGESCVFIDTLYMSQYIEPDLNGHGIEAWGERLGFPKIDYFSEAKSLGIIPSSAKKGDEFSVWHPNMGVYCERDVDVNIKVFWELWNKFTNLYSFADELPSHYRCGQKQWWLMSCQEFSGWKFDIEYAKELREEIDTEMIQISTRVESQLPPRKLKKTEQKAYTMPTKPFKKDGTLSAAMVKWAEKHNCMIDGKQIMFDGEWIDIEPSKELDVKVPMTISNQDDMKEWLLESGWVPTLFNFKRGKDGKPERDPKTRQLIPTTPKIQEGGRICKNLLDMEGDLVKDVVKWLSLRNRLSVIDGWLSDPRLEMDGRLSPSRTGITPTHRQKHAKIVNVPKASEKVLLGKEFRSLFICEDDMLIAAADAAALEGRVEGHYTWKYDQGARAKVILEGDVHSNNAKIFFGEETAEFDVDSPDFDKDHPKFKPYRDLSKNGAYCLAYGGSAKKLAQTLGKPEQQADKLYEAFWDGNPSLKGLRDNLTRYWETAGGKKFIPAIDGRKLVTRKKSALINQLFQSTGAIAMDIAGCFMDVWLGGIKWDENWKPYYSYKGYIVRRIGYTHDEYEYECSKEIAHEVGNMVEKAIEKAGEYLKLNVPLKGEYKVGKNWKETH